MSQSIGKTIKKLRKERNFTQEELAEQLNVTPQAVSKWENEAGMPDISQIIPLASVFGVSTDVLLGFERTTIDDEAIKIATEAFAAEEYGKPETYLIAYDMMTEGLKKHPNNLILLNNCMGLGLSLSLPENGWIYASERAAEIAAETIRQANLIISYSRNIDDIMRAHQALVFLYSSAGDYDKAEAETRQFPVRSDFTLYSNMARINEFMRNYERAVKDLCNDNDYLLQYIEDNAARLGMAYFNIGKYDDAITVYKTFFDVMKAIFKGETFPPYHDFDSGDCYILLAQAYLATGDMDKAMNSVENSVMYYLDLCNTFKYDKFERRELMKTPFVRETEQAIFIDKTIIKEKLLNKLSDPEIEPLKKSSRYKALYEKVNSIE
ncbi:MAG: helix-turn-helix transcriptional regulator [Eubacteriales bacterium]|nr:helix-turn-helix transcriptional regulator [Eubacteriales bacterium]